LTSFVVDASVAAKWVLSEPEEPLTQEARQLVAMHAVQQLRLFVPDLFWAEVGNVLWKAVRRQRMSPEVASAALEKLRELGLSAFPSAELVSTALRIASACNRSVYDSVYVALSVISGTVLITADEKLVNALAGLFSVRWLGALRDIL
jgi:predicted nucleic acid-binding protein